MPNIDKQQISAQADKRSQSFEGQKKGEAVSRYYGKAT